VTTHHDIPYLDRLHDELTRSIEATSDAPARAPRRFVVAAGATVAVVVAGLTAAALMRSGTSSPVPVPSTPPVETTGGGLIGSCIQGGTAQAIGERQYGLSGTIVDVTVPSGEFDPTEVTVEVDHWYRAGGFGDATTVVLKTSTRPAGAGEPVSLVGGQVPLEVGTRILATGDDDFLWDCGDFSRPWSEEGAALFEQAFGG
jgi:hypothetical protein